MLTEKESKNDARKSYTTTFYTTTLVPLWHDMRLINM